MTVHNNYPEPENQPSRYDMGGGTPHALGELAEKLMSDGTPLSNDEVLRLHQENMQQTAMEYAIEIESEKPAHFVGGLPLPDYLPKAALFELTKWSESHDMFKATDKELSKLTEHAREIRKLRMEYHTIASDVHAANADGGGLGFEQSRQLVRMGFEQYLSQHKPFEASDPNELYNAADRYWDLYLDIKYSDVYPEDQKEVFINVLMKMNDRKLDKACKRPRFEQSTPRNDMAVEEHHENQQTRREAEIDKLYSGEYRYRLPARRSGPMLETAWDGGRTLMRHANWGARDAAEMMGEAFVMKAAAAYDVIDEKELGHERPEYRKQGDALLDVVMAEGANVGGVLSGLVVRKIEGYLDGQQQEFVAFNPDMERTDRYGLGEIRATHQDTGADVRKYVATPPNRRWQEQGIRNDDSQYIRQPHRTQARQKIATATGFLAAGGVEAAAFVVDADVLHLAQKTVVYGPETLNTVADVAPVIGGLLLAGVAAWSAQKLALKPRLSRGEGRYGIIDLKQRTELASNKIDSEPFTPDGVDKRLLVPNAPFRTKLSRAEAQQIGLLDKQGKPADVDLSRHGIQAALPKNEDDPLKLEVKFGDLFTTLAMEEHPDNVKSAWELRLYNGALTARTLINERREAAKIYLQKRNVSHENNGHNQELTDAAALALRSAELKLAAHAVGMLKQQEIVRFTEARQLVGEPTHAETIRPIMAHRLRDVIWDAVGSSMVKKEGQDEPMLPADAHSSVIVLRQLSLHLQNRLNRAADNADLEAVYKGTYDKFAGKIDLPDWHQVGHQINKPA